MLGTAIPTGAGRKRADQIYLGKELDEITGTDGTGLHEILVGFVRKTGAHKHVQHIVDGRLSLANVQSGELCQGPRQVGVAAIMVIPARQ